MSASPKSASVEAAVQATRFAAQYVRMSTDRQDLSPIIQKHAIAKFAAENGFQIVRSYEDEGKSGVQLSNRPGLRELLRAVTDEAPFTEVLVYDVSRWGRFQDADAAAYYEYHCRLHGVQVTYIAESFVNDRSPASVLIKSMRRVMAAEYSRDIAEKSRAGQERVICMGFHMGALPPLGYRRSSLSADGSRRVLLARGERKVALTDRVKWVLGPQAEVALVQRICAAYVGGVALEEIAGLLRADGWRTEKGRVVSTQSLKLLLKHEALIGNFVWGAKSKGGKVISRAPSRAAGSVPRIIDDETWNGIQERLRLAAIGVTAKVTDATAVRSRPRQLTLALTTQASCQFRRALGSPQELRNHTREFGRALCGELVRAGMTAAFDTRSNVLSFWGARIRVRLMWPCGPEAWVLERSRCIRLVDHTLVSRMRGLFRPMDFFIFPGSLADRELSYPVPATVPRRLAPFLCATSEALIRRLTEIGSAPLPQRSATGKNERARN